MGVDGWYAIINKHPQFDGIEFEQDAESCTCRIYRKDRQRPTVVTEYLDECKRETDPWRKYPKRMLRHKAAIQCARVAFSLSGIYEPDEAERIQESDKAPQNITPAKSVATGNLTNPEFEALVFTLEEEAKKGTSHLETYWKTTLTKEQRKIVGMNEITRIKENAKQYDNIQEAEYEEA